MHQNTELHFEWAEPLAADIAAAQSSLLVTALSLHPMRKVSASPLGRLWLEIAGAAARGLLINFILPAPSRSHPATAMNGQAADALRAVGARCHFAPPARLLHAKTACIDARITWIGSGNWTAAAASHNHEAYVRTVCPVIAERISARWATAFFLGVQ